MIFAARVRERRRWGRRLWRSGVQRWLGGKSVAEQKREEAQKRLEDVMPRLRVNEAIPEDGVVIGLDISTRATGIGVVCALDGGTIVGERAVLRPSPSSMLPTRQTGITWETGVTGVRGDGVGLFGMANRVLESVSELANGRKVVAVGVQDFLRGFAPGRFHTQGLFTLARLNGAVAVDTARLMTDGGDATFYTPNRVRSFFNLHHKSTAIKEDVISLVSSYFPTSFTFTSMTEQGVSDRADALLLARFTAAMRWEERVLASLSTLPHPTLFHLCQPLLPKTLQSSESTTLQLLLLPALQAMRLSAGLPLLSSPSLLPPAPGIGQGMQPILATTFKDIFSQVPLPNTSSTTPILRIARAIARTIRAASTQKFAQQ